MIHNTEKQIALAGRPGTAPQTGRLSWALQRWRPGDYLALTKPEISFLVVLSSVAGFALGSPGDMDLALLSMTVVGIGLSSAGASALNHYLERDLDATMKRTAGRPVPSGRVPATHARNYSLVLMGSGLGILCPLVNPLTASLAALTILLYVFIYTPLKQTTVLNTLIGTIPGALPVIGGYAAATNSISGLSAWLLFAVLLTWQMPHFLSLAWMYRKDYERGGFAMLSVRDGSGLHTVRQTAAFTAAMISASLLLAWSSELGPLYIGVAVAAAALMVAPVIAFARSRTNGDARRVLKASVMYIPIIVLAILLDRIV